MKAVIMAGGLGKRLEPFTKIIPKPLLPIGEKSILELIIQRLKSFGCDEVIIATNYKSELFEKYLDPSELGLKITFSKENEPLGTGGPLKLVRDKLTEPFIVMNGDILTTIDFNKLKETHSKSGAQLTVCSKEIEMPLHYGVLDSKDGIIVDSVREKPSIKAEINAGIYMVNPEAVDKMPDGFYNMTDLIRDLLANKEIVAKHTIQEYWLDIGHISTYEKAQEDAQNGLLK